MEESDERQAFQQNGPIGFHAAAGHQPAEVNGAAYRRVGESRRMLEQHDGRSSTAERHSVAPAAPAAYPAVNDPPTPRTERVLTDEEQKKLEDDLIKSRKRVQDGAKPGTVGNR